MYILNRKAPVTWLRDNLYSWCSNLYSLYQEERLQRQERLGKAYPNSRTQRHWTPRDSYKIYIMWQYKNYRKNLLFWYLISFFLSRLRARSTQSTRTTAKKKKRQRERADQNTTKSHTGEPHTLCNYTTQLERVQGSPFFWTGYNCHQQRKERDSSDKITALYKTDSNVWYIFPDNRLYI